ncbi:hypothetical protein L6452_45737 [Arctium lappa]|nr:hypothetical protein L6452_45737 [Arctium lappa]
MKNVAKCDTWCELQNPVNHRVFERKLRPKPFGRGHVCLGVTHRVAPDHASPVGMRVVWAETGLPCPWCGWPKKESPLTDARLVVVVKAFVSSRADAREALSNDPNVSSCNDASTATTSGWGPAMRPGRMWNGESRSANTTRGVDRCGLVRRPKARAVDMPVEMPSRRSWLAARAVTACLGTCVLPAPACGHPIRPVLKHGPRSLTCPAHPGIDSVGGKGSRQNGSVTSGKGLASEGWARGVPVPNSSAVGGPARAASAAESGSPRAGPGDGLGTASSGAFPGREQPTQNWYGQGNPTV